MSSEQAFSQHAVPAIEALNNLAGKLTTELEELQVYYGEDPKSSKPEDLFGTIVSFSSALQVRPLTPYSRDGKLLNRSN
jgi:hypothetical protein